MLGRSCQSARFRHADRQKPGRWSFFSSRRRKRTLYRRFRELAWVGGCVTAPAARTSPGRWRGSQPRAPWYFGSIRTAHHGGHGAVDIVGPVAPPGHARGLGNAGVYTNQRKWPLGIVLGHLCTLLRLARVTRAAVGTQECTQIGGSGLSEPFWGICVHCCAVVDRCGDAGVYTNRQKWPLGAVLGHLCTLLRLARVTREWRRR